MQSDSDSGRLLLLVSAEEKDSIHLEEILGRGAWQLFTAKTCREAVVFARVLEVPVVLCRSKLEDGTWKDVLSETNKLKHPPSVVVLSESTDACLAPELPDVAGYEVLRVPLKLEQTLQTVKSAHAAWRRKLPPYAASRPSAASLG
jgi:DNA-binding NtrC family response regulator